MVVGHTEKHVADVGADRLAEARDRVHEAQLRGKERVRGVLDRLGGGGVCDDQRGMRPGEKRTDTRSGALVRRSYDDPLGMQRVVDRIPLPQELRVGDDRDIASVKHPFDHEASNRPERWTCSRLSRRAPGPRRSPRQPTRGSRYPQTRHRAAGSARRERRTPPTAPLLQHRLRTTTARRQAPRGASLRGRLRGWSDSPTTASPPSRGRCRLQTPCDRDATGTQPW